MFNIGDKVKHRNGDLYEIIRVPSASRLIEATSRPYYEYVGESGISWIRDAEEMEDGRFELLNQIEEDGGSELLKQIEKARNMLLSIENYIDNIDNIIDQESLKPQQLTNRKLGE